MARDRHSDETPVGMAGEMAIQTTPRRPLHSTGSTATKSTQRYSAPHRSTWTRSTARWPVSASPGRDRSADSDCQAAGEVRRGSSRRPRPDAKVHRAAQAQTTENLRFLPRVAALGTGRGGRRRGGRPARAAGPANLERAVACGRRRPGARRRGVRSEELCVIWADGSDVAQHGQVAACLDVESGRRG